MKRKKAGKGMALILAAAMTAGLLGGCGGGKRRNPEGQICDAR